MEQIEHKGTVQGRFAPLPEGIVGVGVLGGGIIKLNESLDISQVVAGCMRAADSGMEEKDFLKFVEECMEMGVTTFDHAPVYGNYTCERLFGDAVLRKRPELRHKMQIVTKTGIVLPGRNNNKTIYYESTKKEIRKEMDESLQKLGTDYVDLLLVHRPERQVRKALPKEDR